MRTFLIITILGAVLTLYSLYNRTSDSGYIQRALLNENMKHK